MNQPGAADRFQADIAVEDAHDLLVRAGFLRQAYSGIFHMLPLGLRVQEKLERLIDKHMQSLGMFTSVHRRICRLMAS